MSSSNPGVTSSYSTQDSGSSLSDDKHDMRQTIAPLVTSGVIALSIVAAIITTAIIFDDQLNETESAVMSKDTKSLTQIEQVEVVDRISIAESAEPKLVSQEDKNSHVTAPVKQIARIIPVTPLDFQQNHLRMIQAQQRMHETQMENQMFENIRRSSAHQMTIMQRQIDQQKADFERSVQQFRQHQASLNNHLKDDLSQI